MDDLKKDYKILIWNEMLYLIIIILIIIGILNVSDVFLNGNYIIAGITFSIAMILFLLNFYIKYFIIYIKGKINNLYIKIMRSDKKLLLPSEEQKPGNIFDRNNIPTLQIVVPFFYLRYIKKIIKLY